MIHRYRSAPLAVAALVLAACASSGTSTVYRDSGLTGTRYSNLLVVGVAGSYNSRAQFERQVVSALQSRGLQAAAFHAVAGGDMPVNRDTVSQALAGKDFDGVILTRVLDSSLESELKDPVTGTKVSRKEGNVFNLFRYDYEDLEDAPALTTKSAVNFRTDLYSTADGKLAWSIESKSKTFDNVGELIDSVAKTIVSRLDRDGLLAQ